MIRRYSYALSGQEMRPRTVRGAMHAIRALFGFLVETGVLPKNVAREVRLPKKDAATRLLVTDEDLVKLLEARDRQRLEFHCVRDRAVLSSLIFCGRRRQKLLDLQIRHINLDDASLLGQQGKGQNSRTIYLCDAALVALRVWLAYRPKLACKHDYVFEAHDRRRIGENSLYSLIQNIAVIAGYKDDPRIKPHSIRYAAATRLLRHGADIRSIQTFLGHSQLQTTAIYLHTDEEQVRRIAPLAGFKQSADFAPPKQVAGEGRPRPHQGRSFIRRSES